MLKDLIRLLTLLVFILLCLVVYHVIVAWVWRNIGFMWNWNHGRIFGWFTFVVRGVMFPILFATLALRVTRNKNRKWWRILAFFLCWLPLMVSHDVDMNIWIFDSGYEATVHDMTEGVGGLIVIVEWIVTTVILWVVFRLSRRNELNEVNSSS